MTFRGDESDLRNRFGFILLGLAGVATLLAVPSLLNWKYGGYMWAERVFDHVVLFAASACVLAILAAGILLRGWMRTAATAGLVLVAIASTFWLWIGSSLAADPWPTGSDVPNSSGTLSTSVLLGGIVDPYYKIYVEQTSRGLLNRRFEVACINGDGLNLKGLHWDGTRLVVETSDGPASISLAADGSPLRAKHARAGAVRGNPGFLATC